MLNINISDRSRERIQISRELDLGGDGTHLIHPNRLSVVLAAFIWQRLMQSSEILVANRSDIASTGQLLVERHGQIEPRLINDGVGDLREVLALLLLLGEGNVQSSSDFYSGRIEGTGGAQEISLSLFLGLSLRPDRLAAGTTTRTSERVQLVLDLDVLLQRRSIRALADWRQNLRVVPGLLARREFDQDLLEDSLELPTGDGVNQSY